MLKKILSVTTVALLITIAVVATVFSIILSAFIGYLLFSLVIR